VFNLMQSYATVDSGSKQENKCIRMAYFIDMRIDDIRYYLTKKNLTLFT
jgi:hypothetical protein